MSPRLPAIVCGVLAAVGADDARATGSELFEVGPLKFYSRIEEALAKASPGAVIAVYPRRGNKPYESARGNASPYCSRVYIAAFPFSTAFTARGCDAG